MIKLLFNQYHDEWPLGNNNKSGNNDGKSTIQHKVSDAGMY